MVGRITAIGQLSGLIALACVAVVFLGACLIVWQVGRGAVSKALVRIGAIEVEVYGDVDDNPDKDESGS